MKVKWKAYRYRLEKWGCDVLERWIPRLSYRAFSALAQVAGSVAYWLDAKSRHIALENLRVVFGDRLSATQKRRIARLSFENFAQAMLSLFWSSGFGESEMRRWVKTEGFAHLCALAREKKCGVVFACAHFGNWELAAMSAQIHEMPVQILAENFKNATLDEIFARLRGRGYHEVIRQDRSFLKLLRRALRGQHCALLADLTVPPSQAAVRVRAFPRGGEALEICCTRLPAVVAMRAKALVVPALAHPRADGSCEVRAIAPFDACDFESEEQMTQAIWENVEQAILKAPHLWLWSYKHFRYKPKEARREYPDYAIFHPDFEATARA